MGLTLSRPHQDLKELNCDCGTRKAAWENHNDDKIFWLARALVEQKATRFLP